MTEWTAKRFWKETAVAPAEDAAGFIVLLDSRPLRTPAKAALALPSQTLAERVAAEWDAQGEVITPAAMPFTRTANSAIDKVVPQQGAVADMLAEYGDADLLCYRAATPTELVERQAATWDPLLDWAAETYAARLKPRTGIMHAPQEEAALARLRAEVHALDAFRLAAFHDLVTLSGSLILALAATKNHAPVHELWEHSRLDETWQQEQWGHDEEAAALAETKRQAFLHAHVFFHLVDAKP